MGGRNEIERKLGEQDACIRPGLQRCSSLQMARGRGSINRGQAFSLVRC